MMDWPELGGAVETADLDEEDEENQRAAIRMLRERKQHFSNKMNLETQLMLMRRVCLQHTSGDELTQTMTHGKSHVDNGLPYLCYVLLMGTRYHFIDSITCTELKWTGLTLLETSKGMSPTIVFSLSLSHKHSSDLFHVQTQMTWVWLLIIRSSSSPSPPLSYCLL